MLENHIYLRISIKRIMSFDDEESRIFICEAFFLCRKKNRIVFILSAEVTDIEIFFKFFLKL